MYEKNQENKDKNNENNNGIKNRNRKRTVNKHKSGQGKALIRNKIKDGLENKEESNNSDYESYFDESEQDEEEDDDNNEHGIIKLKRPSRVHKSGQGKTIFKEKNKNKEDNNNIGNKDNINNINNSFSKENTGDIIDNKENLSVKDENKNQKNNNSANNKKVMMIKKRPVKAVEYERFAHNFYVITNYKSKSNGKKNLKEMKKYIFCKQIDFILYAIYNPEDVYGSDYEDEIYLENGKIFKGKVLSNKINKNKLLKSKKSANYDKTNSKYDDSFKNVSRFTINKANKNNNVNVLF